MAELVCGTREEIARVFTQIVPRQPIRWDTRGIVCAPMVDPAVVLATVAPGPLPVQRVPLALAAWPAGPARMIGDWYVRTEHHAPAPRGIRELVYAPGEGFGPIGHVTTEMCLLACDRLPSAPAVDVGCGAGLLAQAWAAARGAPVLAVDLDPAAVRQTRASCALAGHEELVTVSHRGVHTLTTAELAGRVVLANVPLPVHAALAHRGLGGVSGVVASGIRERDLPTLLAYYRAAGLSPDVTDAHRRFVCVTLVAST